MAFLNRNTDQAERPRITLKQRAKVLVSKTANVLHLRLPLRRRVTAEHANAERRALVAGTFAAAAVVPFPTTAFGGGNGPGVDAIAEATHAEWRALMTEYRAAMRAYQAAAESLPWWAQPGPSMLNHKGEHVGIPIGWPAVENLVPPENPDVLKVLRPNKFDLSHEFEEQARAVGRERALGPYRRELRALAGRLRAKKDAEFAAGIPAIEKQMGALGESLNALAARIEEAEPRSFGLLAVWILNELQEQVVDHTTLSGEYMRGLGITLETIRPHLSGAILRDVAELLDNLERPIAETYRRWFGAIWSATRDAEADDEPESGA